MQQTQPSAVNIQKQKQAFDLTNKAETQENQSKSVKKENKGHPSNPVVQVGQNFKDQQDEQEYAMSYEGELEDFRNQIQTNVQSKARKSVELKPQKAIKMGGPFVPKQFLDKSPIEKGKGSLQNLQQTNLNEKRAQIAQEIIKKAQQNKKRGKNGQQYQKGISDFKANTIKPDQIRSELQNINGQSANALGTIGSIRTNSPQLNAYQDGLGLNVQTDDQESDQDLGSIDLQFRPAYVLNTQASAEIDGFSDSEQQQDQVAQVLQTNDVNGISKEKKQLKQNTKKNQTISTNTNSGSLKRNQSQPTVVKKQKAQLPQRIHVGSNAGQINFNSTHKKQQVEKFSKQADEIQPEINVFNNIQDDQIINQKQFVKSKKESNAMMVQKQDQNLGAQNRRNKFESNQQRSVARGGSSQSPTQDVKIIKKMSEKRQSSHKRQALQHNFQFQVNHPSAAWPVTGALTQNTQKQKFSSQPRKPFQPRNTQPVSGTKWQGQQNQRLGLVKNNQRTQTTNSGKHVIYKESQKVQTKKTPEIYNQRSRTKVLFPDSYKDQHQQVQSISSPKQTRMEDFDNISPVGAVQRQYQTHGFDENPSSKIKSKKQSSQPQKLVSEKVESLMSKDSLGKDVWENIDIRQERPSMTTNENALHLQTGEKFGSKATSRQDDEDLQLIELMREMRDFEKTQMFQKQRMDNFEEQIIKRVRDIQKYAKGINVTIKRQIQPDIIKLQNKDLPMDHQEFNLQLQTHDQQIQEITQQLLEKNTILQTMMTFQEQIMQNLTDKKDDCSGVDKVKQWWSQEIRQHKKHFHQIDDVKRAMENLQKQNQFQANNIDNLQQQISSQIQLNSNVQESQVNLKQLELQYQAAIKQSEEQLDKARIECKNGLDEQRKEFQAKIEAISQPRQLMQIEERLEVRVREIEQQSVQEAQEQENKINQLQEQVQALQRGRDHVVEDSQIPVNQVNQEIVTHEILFERLESLKIELQVFGHDQNDILKQQMIEHTQEHMQRLLRRGGAARSSAENPNRPRPSQAQQHGRAVRGSQRGVNPAIQGQPSLANQQNAEDENIHFDRSHHSEGAVSASIRRAATEIQEEDHPHLLAMQDSHFDQIDGSYDNDRQHQSQQNLAIEQNNNIMNQSMRPANDSRGDNDEDNLFRNQEQLHISHESNLQIHVGALVAEPGSEDPHNNQLNGVEDEQQNQGIQLQVQALEARLGAAQGLIEQFSRGLQANQGTLHLLEQRLITDSNENAQSLQQMTEIKDTATIILRNLDTIQSRVQNIENQDQDHDTEIQIDSSSARVDRRAIKALKDQLKKEIEPLMAQSDQNQQDMQTLQHLIGMIQDSNFQNQIDNLRRILNRQLRNPQTLIDDLDSRVDQIGNQSSAQNRIVFSPNVINMPNSDRNENVMEFDQAQIQGELFEEEAKVDNQEDIYMDRDQNGRRNRVNTASRHQGPRIPNLESPQRYIQDASLGQGNMIESRDSQVRIQNVQQQQTQFNQQLEISQDHVVRERMDSRSSRERAAAERNRGERSSSNLTEERYRDQPEPVQLYNSISAESGTSARNQEREQIIPEQNAIPNLDIEVIEDPVVSEHLSLSGIQFENNPDIGRDPLRSNVAEPNVSDNNFFSPVSSREANGREFQQIPSSSPIQRRQQTSLAPVHVQNIVEYEGQEPVLERDVERILNELVEEYIHGDIDNVITNILNRETS